MRRNLLGRWSAALLSAWLATTAQAQPSGPQTFCETYPTSPACQGKVPDCSYCHTSAPALNAYGTCLGKALGSASFDAALPGALASVESADCDGDGAANAAEIFAGTFPGDPASKPAGDAAAAPPPTDPSKMSCEDRSRMSGYDLCGYDPEYAFRKVHIDFCRRPVDYGTLVSFRKLDAYAKQSAVRTALHDCLASEAWIGKDGVLWDMAHAKIQPIQTLKSGDDQGSVPLGDYDDDYNLWVYYNTEGRDVRGVLTSQRFVVREDRPTSYREVDEMPLHPKAGGVPPVVAAVLRTDTQQFVPKDKRAGMITTMWGLTMRTMFTSVPRSNTSQILRAFLGIDIAKSEGLDKLYPHDSSFELVDYDNKGVEKEACAYCHVALDPTTYVFAPYNGLNFGFPTPSTSVDLGGKSSGTTSSLGSALKGRLSQTLLRALGVSAECQTILSSSSSLDLGSVFSDTSGAVKVIDCIPEQILTKLTSDPSFIAPGIYKENRLDVLAETNAASEPNLAATPRTGYLFGEPVQDLVEWAHVAADSDEFAQNVVRDYWKLLTGRAPKEDEKAVFDRLWTNLKTKHAYSVEAMLQELVETEVYGAP